MVKDISVEYAHIYTNGQVGEEQKFSLSILDTIKQEFKESKLSLVVMVDDYSFPDPSFDYEMFVGWLAGHDHQPDIAIRESQLIPFCDQVLNELTDTTLKAELITYVRQKKYPCSLFVATWYLLRLGCISGNIFDSTQVAEKLINILPISFKPFEDRAFDIIKHTRFAHKSDQIENRYFEGRVIR